MAPSVHLLRFALAYSNDSEFTDFHSISPCLKHGGYQMPLTILAVTSEFRIQLRYNKSSNDKKKD